MKKRVYYTFLNSLPPSHRHHVQILDLCFHVFLSQVEFGDLERHLSPSPGGTPPSKAQHHLQQVLDRFYPRRYRYGTPTEQLR